MGPDRGGPGRPVLGVRGMGLRLPGVAAPADLLRQLTGDLPVPGAERRLTAAHSDLPPVERWVPGPVEPRLPAGLPVRGLRNWPAESVLALAAAADAVLPDRHPADAVPVPALPGRHPAAPAPDPVASHPIPDVGPDSAVLWASSTAGLSEYAGVCLDAALLDPGLTSPVIAPVAAYNGPASTVSIRLGLTGPIESLTGGVTAGMSAVVEAGRFLFAGEASRALVGGSASISRWSLAGLAGGFGPAEGAACLALEPGPGPAGAVTLGVSRRIGPDAVRGTGGLRDLVRAAGPVAAVVVSTPDPTVVDVLSGLAGSVWHVEHRLGDFGAAGGFLAVVCAIARCATVDRPATVLALAVEPAGYASSMEVSS